MASFPAPISISELSNILGYCLDHAAYEKLEQYANSLFQWNCRINLIGQSSVEHFWKRHIVDSLQLIPLLPCKPDLQILDIGSGGGLPGIVLATLPSLHVKLVESDKRKSAFLQHIISTLSLDAMVIPNRIESLPPASVNIITSRACAPLSKLLAYAAPFCSDRTIALFHKGKNWRDEYENACNDWHFSSTITPSVIQSDSVIISVTNVRPR